ncbi:XPA protein C-terminus-domain-containing protein [Lobosporangium transversale]|uniref:XPA protein C-terminus-domain-containing protein n=1 Tax=Lobosporangium transversale TaxID=64571 RepID=A0A1Y2GNJ2_9FUNG|nr:XPA protein C-terminus-domain-containing protein [Lobosporangium transversale]ORZ16753.1 XPA protein C-terminus-domain-containing protein [Lobosporangium transversale]|eukprot:XP_021881688.1 XPA protein C-terminus-domain-containing protein [Lobosporangium transversale]
MEAVEPLPKNAWTKFYDYDLSSMKDTKAGFIQELDEKDTVGAGGDTETENNRKRKWQPTKAPPDPSIFLGAEDNFECQDCTSVDVDFQLLQHFHVPVCVGCRDAQPEKYSLLTKTECRLDYLLTDPELRDTELFPHWERPNPKKATWNNMMLYLRCQVEEFAFKKWGGPEGLDREFERRERDKEARKEIKFKKELRDLRNKTRTSVWQDKKAQQRVKVHTHSFGTALVDPESGASVQTCIECGIQVECEEF